MSRQHVVDAIGIIGGMLLAAFWILSLLRQPLSQVSQVLDRDYAAALPVVRQIMGPLPEPMEAEPVVDQRGLGASMGVVAKLTATLKTFMAVYPRLLSVRGFPFAAVFLMGVPLVLAAWHWGPHGNGYACARDAPPIPGCTPGEGWSPLLVRS